MARRKRGGKRGRKAAIRTTMAPPFGGKGRKKGRKGKSRR